MPKTLTATEYARVSKDKSGRLRSVGEQSVENRDAVVDEQGWDWLPTIYVEEGEASASVFGTVVREGFEALLADLRSDQFPADVLVLWEPSRGSRQMREWVDLIDALAAAGVLLFVTSEGRTYDVRKPKDRRDLQDAANEAEYYSGRLSVTLKRAHRAQAREGRWSGVAPFGYRRVWSEDGTVAQVPDEPAATYVRTAFEEIAAGGSIAGIVKRWNDTGETGRSWSTQALRAVLLNPAYVGVRIHSPRSRHESRSAAAQRQRGVTEHEAAWEPIVDRAVADRVRVLLTDPTRRRHRSTGVAHLLSNVAVCSVCDRPLTTRNADRPVYRCVAGCVQAREDEADAWVGKVVVRYLQRETLGPPADADTATVIAARAEVTAAEEYLQEVAQAAEQGLSPLLVAKMEQQGRERLAAAQAAVRRVSMPSALAAALPTEPMTDDVWAAMTLQAKRRLLRAVFGDAESAAGGPIRIRPGGRGRRLPVSERIGFADLEL
jgi:DNA invertase Pin-like site-specific DNA recombinase